MKIVIKILLMVLPGFFFSCVLGWLMKLAPQAFIDIIHGVYIDGWDKETRKQKSEEIIKREITRIRAQKFIHKHFNQ